MVWCIVGVWWLARRIWVVGMLAYVVCLYGFGCLVYLVGFRLLCGCCLLVDIVEGCVALLLGFWWLEVLGWLF